MVNLLLVDVILEALAHFNPARAIAHSGASSALGIAWSKAPPGPVHHAVRDRRLRLWRRHRPRRRDRDRDAPEQPAHHADRDSGIRISLPHHALRSGAGFRRRRRSGAAGSPCDANTSCWKTPPSIRRFNKTRFPPAGVAGGKDGSARPLRGTARHAAGIRDAGLGAASRCRRASASCCRAPAAAATAIRQRDRDGACSRYRRRAMSRSTCRKQMTAR